MRFLFLIVLTTFILPSIVFAQLVPCGNVVNGALKECNWADLITLAGNILNFIVTLAVIASGVVFAIAGLLYFTAGGNSEKIHKAHSLFTAVVIGLVIILTAWLIVNTILVTLTGKGIDARKPDAGSTNSSYQKAGPGLLNN